MAEPRRQRSFKDRLHGISIPWQSKKSESYPEQSSSNTQIEAPKNIINSNTLSVTGFTSKQPLVASSSVPVKSSTFQMDDKSINSSQLNSDSTVNNETCERKISLTRSLTQPQGTTEYMVSSTDTLAGIAARYETTPSELTKINRLSSRLIFPGQIMYVPKRGDDSNEKQLTTPPNSPTEKASSTESMESSPKPGHAKRIGSEESQSISMISSNSQENKPFDVSNKPKRIIDPADRECLERFLKINARHITDGQGVVNGVLLVTPNALMFDPNVSDPLVIEHGAEYYGVTVPMELVIKTAMYSDIAHMRVKHAPDASPSIPRPKVYYGPEKLEDEKLLKDTFNVIGSYSKEIIKQDSDSSKELDKTEGAEAETGKEEGAEAETGKEEGAEAETGREEGAAVEAERKNESISQSKNKLPVQPSDNNTHVDEKKEIDKTEQGTNETLNEPERKESEDNKTDEGINKSEAGTSEDAGSFDKKVSEENTQSLSEDLKDDLENKNDVFESIDESEILPLNKENIENNQDQVNKAAANKENVQQEDIQENLTQKQSLGLRHSVPEGKPNRGLYYVSTNSADDPSEIEKRRSVQGESRREQMLKRLSNPVESISNYTKSGISSGINVTKSGINATKSGISTGINVTKSGISTGISATKSGFNKVLATPKNIVEFSSGLVRDAKGALSSSSSSKQDSLEAELESIPNTKGNNQNSNPIGDQKSQNNQEKGKDNRQSSIGYKNMVDTEIDVFANFEKLIPRPARSCDDPPLYLCLRMGKPINKKLQKYSPAIISFGKKKIEREYWFSIPKEKADTLYHFFVRWAPETYGDVDDVTGCEQRGLLPIDTDDEDEDEYDRFDSGEIAECSGIDGNILKTLAPEKPKFWRKRGPLNFLKLVEGTFTIDDSDWENVSSSAKHHYLFEFTGEIPLPELIGASDVLTEEMRKNLSKHLPARAEGYSWTLIYSTSKHGFSLKTLYREMLNYDTPVLLVIQDTFNNVFGALTSSALRLSDHFYGTGETFLYTFHPEFQCFPWTGENLFFIKGNPDSIAIGAGDGNFGLWLDGDLYHGRNHPCKTFGNTLLTSREDFVVKNLECWGFIN